MTLRSRPHTAAASSGPGRPAGSDGRTRHRRHRGAPARRGPRQQRAPAEELRRRAQALLTEHSGRVAVPGSGPPRTAQHTGPHPPARDTRPAPSWSRPLEVTDEDGDRRAHQEAPSPAALVTADGSAPAVAPGHGEQIRPEVTRREGAWRERAGLALRERMPLWLQTRCGLERRNVIALAVLFTVAAGLALQYFWTGRTHTVRAPEVVRAAAPYRDRGKGEDTTPAAPVTPPAADAPTGPEIVVDVSGKVRHPGIHRLPAHSRVADALRAAGGVRPGTDLHGLNRARFLADGEQVVVGGPAPPPGAPAAGTAGGGPAGPTTPVSLSTATAEQLETLPGVGPVLAQHIIDYRTRHGTFRSVDELRQVTGIGDRRFADLRSLVTP